MDQLALFVIFVKASVLSVGGLASLPILRPSLVPLYATDAQIVQALAIGRLSPGPNGVYIVSVGYIVGGWAGAFSAFLAATLVPLTILPATTLARRWLMSAWFAGLVRGVFLASAGLLSATGVIVAIAAGTAPWQLLLGLVAVLFTVQGRVHPALLVGVGAAVGIALGR